MWEESDTNEGDKPDSVLAFRSGSREHRFGHKISTVVECSEEEEEEGDSSDEEYLRYNTSFAQSFAELAYTQSGPADSVINSFLINEEKTRTVSSKQKFNVLVHAQTTSELPKENGKDPSSFVIENCEVTNVSESDNLSTGTNSYDISSPSLHLSPRSDIPATISSADVISASKPVTNYTSESGYSIERDTETSSSSTLVSTSQRGESESNKEVGNSDLHIEEEDYPTHESQGEKDVFFEVEDKLNSSFSSQSSSASNHTSRPTSLSRYERLSGSEPDTLISKEPGAIRVHSERAGGWEGVSHELVYPLSPEQWRREARRRKWQNQATKDEVESVSFVISIDRKSSEPTRDRFRTTYQHRTVTVPDKELPYFKPRSGNVQTISFGSSADIYGTDEIPKKMTEKQALVDRRDQDQDCNPLIDDASKEEKENENMPFGFFKKKETTAEAEASKTETEAADSKTTKSADVVENGETAKESTTPEEDTSKVTVDKTDKDGNVAVAFTTSPTEGTDGAETKEGVQPPKTSTKTEKSPLIEADATEAADNSKDSKVRDHSPGFLCCTIL